jgi:hypothetical protein
MLHKLLLSILYLFACINVCHSQALILQKKDRTKQFSVGDYFTIDLPNPENELSDGCSYLKVYGELREVSPDSIRIQAFKLDQNACNSGRHSKHLQVDFIAMDSVAVKAIAKSDIRLIQTAGSYKWEKTRKNIKSVFNLIGISGFVLGIGGIAIGDEKGSDLQNVALWMLVSAIAVNTAVGTKRTFQTSQSFKKNKKSKKKEIWQIQ